MVARRYSLAIGLLPALLFAAPNVTSPKKFFGHEVGDDYYLSNYTQFSDYWRLLDKESDRMSVQSIGKTAEGRDQLMAIVSSPANLKKLKRYQEIAKKLCIAEGLTDDEAKKLALEGKTVVWIDGGLHASEVLGAQQLIETCYQMVSKDDPETKRILDNVIILFVHANPDGMELCSNWYMQEPNPKDRNLRIPRLYQKYIGHDNNRDFYSVTQSETKNMCKIMYRDWFPQIMYNHHQTGPAGTVMFAPPFRDPFNHNIDPLVMSGIDFVASAMMQRFLSLDMPGVTTKNGAPYSAWWNGGLRTTAYFHNMIGILTETIGNPTPSRIPFVASKRTPDGSLYYPIEPQEWHFRQSVEYSVQANMAVLDLASRYREKFLYDIYRMGKRQIDEGSRDSWTDYPRRTESARSLADLRKPELRNPRAFIVPKDQADFLTGCWFANTLIENGVRVLEAKSPFNQGGKTYPAGTLVVPCDQAFRPHVLDMFEPQDHPDDIPAPGAAPIPPYDSAGYTLAFQMGVRFDRVFDPVKGDFKELASTLSTEPSPTGPAQVSGKANSDYTRVMTHLVEGKPVYRTSSEFSLGQKPSGDSIELQTPRIGLWDRYGGSMESGWTRWILEQFGFPYKIVFPQELDAGNLNSKFDVLIFVDGAISSQLRSGRTPSTEGIPEQYRSWLGSVSEDTIPRLKEFLNNGGSIVTIGSSTSLAKHLGLPVESHLMEDGKPIPRTKYYVPGSILKVKVDNTQPIALGMDGYADVMFDNSPVFKITSPGVVKPIAWFDTETPLRSGWAWGQKYLKDGVAIAEAPVGKGKLYLFGPEVLYRGQSHGTFKFVFNAILLSRPKER
ncbi:MAG: hypothetical protein BGO01_10950 [Armatimonadetes bacterium 55-13]|nr:peptidase [Armatimonadota bacterium]OJU62907.1 MAG: hypothetical protein BGO01_10950 [Armatimonadetes bacterium 55-13]